MSNIQNNINNDFKHNKNIKIKYETSKPNYLLPSNADKIMKYLGNKASNSSHIEDNKFINSNHKNNQMFNKKENSVKKRIKEKNNKDKINKKDSIEKNNNLNNRIKSPKLTIESPLTKSKIHKRINSLHINANKENEKKNLKTIKNKNNFNLNGNNNNKKKLNNKNINSNHKNLENNTNNKNLEPNTISSSNNLSFSNENKKSAKKENNQNNTIQMKIDKLDSNDMHFSFNNNLDNLNLSENGQQKVNLKKNVQIGNNTLSGKIASRAKNLNKMLEENFNNIKKERKEKEKNVDKDYDNKIEDRNELNDNTINSKNLSLNEFEYHSINNSNKSNINNYNPNSKNRLLKPKYNKPLSSELAQKKQKMQHKTASLNRSLELRRKNRLNDNNDLNVKINNLNNSSGKEEKKVFSKNDFRQMNTSPFVRSKPPIKPKHTNCLPRKNVIKKDINNNMKLIDKKYKSPQKDISSVNGFISLELNQKNNNIKKPLLTKKKKVITKRKNKSMIIDNKLKEKNINLSKTHEKEDNFNNKTNLEKENKTIDDSNNLHKKKPVHPVRAQSQKEINTELIIDNINELLDNKSQNKNNAENKDIPLKKIEKKILKLQSLCKKGFAGPGIKKTNQDNFFIYNNFNNNSNYVYMGVCDGWPWHVWPRCEWLPSKHTSPKYEY